MADSQASAIGSAPSREGNGRPASSAGVHAALRVLDLLATRGPLQLAELGRELSAPKSTLHRICAILVDRGWIVRDADGRFDLGIRSLRLGSRAPEPPGAVGVPPAAFRPASGVVVLSSRPPAAVNALFGGRPLVTPTGRRLNGVPELLEILDAVRTRGYAENLEETAV